MYRPKFLDLYDFLMANADAVKWGIGKDAGRVSFRIRHALAKNGYITREAPPRPAGPVRIARWRFSTTLRRSADSSKESLR